MSMILPTIQTDTLERLSGFDTPTIANLVELFEVRPRYTGYTDHRIQACFPELPPIVGFAATATFRSHAAPRHGDAYATLAQQVARFEELAGPPIVVFQDLDDPAAAATFGEVMCSTYKAFGAVGLITSGAGRDLDQVRAIDFPVFTNGTMCAHGYCHTPQCHVPVRVGGLAIAPGDLLHADRNGVISIPLEIASELADVGDEFVAAEKVVLDYVRSSSPTTRGLQEAANECDTRVNQLRARVSRHATR
jgi:regulator of RNase E activity RraA